MEAFDKVPGTQDGAKNDKPIVVLKPSTTEQGTAGLYSINREIYSVTPEAINDLVSFLNNFDVNKKSGITSIDTSNLFDQDLHQTKPVSLATSEKIAYDLKCNILGGIFIDWISSYGIEIEKILGHACVQDGDAEFLEALYPDLIPFFKDRTKLSTQELNLAEGIVYNNTGNFKVLEIGAKGETSTQVIFAKLAFLKRIFRHAVKITIKKREEIIRDNLVHTPQTPEELSIQKNLLQKRFLR